MAKINEPFPDAQLTEAKVFLVSKNGTVVVNKSHLNTASNFKFVSSESNKLIALYPDKRVSVLGNAYFKKLSSTKTKNKTLKILETELLSSKIKSANDLDKISKDI